jgi:tetratricopeptide (TPR) repeat protein/tRNA A-37 threonylcarbamoyl transferase component Bud32
MDRRGTTIGDYRLTELIGRGAMSIVYRAEHVGTGQPAAVKLVELNEPLRLRAMRREIQILGQLRHPGVVRILDEGLHDGAPWYAMELVEGRPLLAPAANGGPEGLSARLGTISRLCRTLAWLHGEGVVHRDLKPQNVLVRPDGMPVLLDFGLVWRFADGEGREPLQIWEAAAGTIEYMSPEQIRGDWMDARADLYSLGCVLYELVSGRPPFVGVPSRVVRAHLRETPSPLSDLVGNVDPALVGLVSRLLAKDPRERFGHADSVAAALETAAARAETDESGTRRNLEAGWPSLPSPRPYLYRPELAGREAEMLELRRDLDCACAKSGRLILVAGESGVGKTRLAMELARAAHNRAQVLMGQCPAPAPGAEHGLHALRPLLQAAADRRDGNGAEALRAVLLAHADLLALFEPSLASLAVGRPLPESARLSPEDGRRAVVNAVAEVLESLAGLQPLCLILDDLQWADELTLETLRFLGQDGRLEQMAVLVVGLERIEESSSEGLHASRRIRLERLSASAVEPIVRDMLGVDEPPHSLVTLLAQRTEGNPLFVAEYLRAAVAAGLLARDSFGRWILHGIEAGASEASLEDLRLPGTLREMLGKRLDRLSDGAHGLLHLAAILGRSFAGPVLETLHGSNAASYASSFRELIRAQVLEPVSSERFQFVHDLIRETALASMPKERCVAFHRIIAEIVETTPALRNQIGAGELANHWMQASESRRAAPYLLEAAREALRRYAHGEAERMYRTYLALDAGANVERVRARFELGRQLLLRGNTSGARDELGRALQECEESPDESLRSRLLCTLGEADWKDGKSTEARAGFQHALDQARATNDRHTEALALDRLANVANEQGDPETAVRLFREALALHEQLGDRWSEALSLTNLAVYHHNRGRLGEAESLYRRALDLHRAVGHRRLEGGTLGNLGIARLEQGHLDDARALLPAALAIVREVGDRRTEAIVLLHLAMASSKGDPAPGVVLLYEEAIRLLREVGARQAQAEALTAFAALRLSEGEGVEAKRLGLEALALLGDSSEPGPAGLAMLELARVERLWEDRPSESWRLAARAREVAAHDAARVQALCEMGHSLLAQGQRPNGILDSIQKAIVTFDHGETSPAAESWRGLERASRAMEAGRSLLRGSCAEDLPPALRRTLLRRGARPAGARA